MAWTAPMTAVSGNVWTSAQFNAHIRDNLLETMPGKATAAGRIFASSGVNSIAERVPSSAQVTATETTTSTTCTDLTTPGPAVTVSTGNSALVWILTRAQHSSNTECRASVAVSSGTTIAASDDWSWLQSGTTSGNPNRFGVCHLFTNLNPGSNVFTMKYRTSSGTATFLHRDLIVIPF